MILTLPTRVARCRAEQGIRSSDECLRQSLSAAPSRRCRYTLAATRSGVPNTVTRLLGSAPNFRSIEINSDVAVSLLAAIPMAFPFIELGRLGSAPRSENNGVISALLALVAICGHSRHGL